MVTIDSTHQDLELRLLFQTLQELYGFDLSEYRETYLLRRIQRRMLLENFTTITQLTNSIIHQEHAGLKFIQDISINVTSMFRFPTFFRFLKDEVFPILKTYPSIRIWHAGCASGEEVLSLAILLEEANLYDKTTIIATDINRKALDDAKDAMYASDQVKQWTTNYNIAGGSESFAKYYDVKYNRVSFDKKLLRNVTFKHHDLTKDPYPKSQHLILCRNVLIYFNQTLQHKVVTKFHETLVPGGYLGLGDTENIDSNIPFTILKRPVKVYRK